MNTLAMTRPVLLMLGVSASFQAFFSVSLAAQGAPPAVESTFRKTLEAKPETPITGELGFDFSSQYFYRGILQEDQGFIMQPWIELAMPLAEPNNAGTGGFDMVVGLWNSLHNGPSGTAGGRQAWYESDFYVGLGTSVTREVTLSVAYTAYASPNAAFATVQEIMVTCAVNDSSLWGDRFGGLRPSAMIAFETDGQADGGNGTGTYLQIGIEPEFSLSESLSLSLAMPLVVGFGQNYYERGTNDDAFGFADLGAVLSMPIGFMPSRFGPWRASLGTHLLWLGENMKALNSGDEFELIASFGIATSF